MNSDIAVKVEHLGKKYTIGKRGKQLSILEFFEDFKNNIRRKKTEDFWALNDVSFEIKRGDVVGIIGRNGAGKSTLLKILSRITSPTTGKVILNGRVASLLEVGTGFSGELTGRENIYLNGSILGMSRKEIDSKFNEIVEFSGVDKFLDTPVKRYSSGMYVRLAFAVAAHLESEILIVDEVLAVGDTDFQKKCLGKMGDVAKSGRTVLFVSHNLGFVKNLCNRTILLKNGNLSMIGSTSKVVDHYLLDGEYSSNQYLFEPDYTLPVQILGVKILNDKSEETNNLLISKPFRVQVTYEVREHIDGWLLSLIFYSSSNEMLTLSDDFDQTNKLLKPVKPGKYIREVTIPAYLFNTGQFFFDAVVHIPLVRFIDRVRGIIFTMISDGGLKIKVYKNAPQGILATKLEHTNTKI